MCNYFSVKLVKLTLSNSAGTDVGRGILQTTDNRVFHIMFLTWDDWSYPQLLLLWGISDRRIAEPLKKTGSMDVWAYLGVNPLDMPRIH